jgi:hypothetical protein
MWVSIVFILFAVLIFVIVRAHYLANKELVEKFEEIQQKTMSKFDRFSVIIRTFETVKNVKPSPNELHALYDHLSGKEKYTSEDVEGIILNDVKLKRIVDAFIKRNSTSPDVDVDANAESQTSTSNNIRNEPVMTSVYEDDAGVLVEKSYSMLLPGEILTSDNKEFLMYKFQKFGNDITKFEEYITTNDEYKNNIRKRIATEFAKHSASDELDAKMFKIARPDTTESTLKVAAPKSDDSKLSCKDLEDEHVLAKLINERNLAQLKYDCLRGTSKQAGVSDNMVLLPDQKWNIPQQRPEVCRMSGEFSYKPSTEQTALIGTLLDDAKDTQVGTILPEFEFKEK